MNTLRRAVTDIRSIIGGVLGTIALYLLICSAFLTGPEEMAKTGGVNANLWAGLGLLLVSVGMIGWQLVRPEQGVAQGQDGS